MNKNKTSWEFLKNISEDELKNFLSTYNINKNEQSKEIFEIQKFEHELRIDLYNFDTTSNKKTKVSYIDILSDFKFYVECNLYDTKFMSKQLLKLFIKKFGINYIEKYLEDYKIKLKQKDDQIFSSLFELRTFSSMNISDNEHCYKQAKKLHDKVSNKTKKIINSLYKETRKNIYQIYKELQEEY